MPKGTPAQTPINHLFSAANPDFQCPPHDRHTRAPSPALKSRGYLGCQKAKLHPAASRPALSKSTRTTRRIPRSELGCEFKGLADRLWRLSVFSAIPQRLPVLVVSATIDVQKLSGAIELTARKTRSVVSGGDFLTSQPRHHHDCAKPSFLSGPISKRRRSCSGHNGPMPCARRSLKSCSTSCFQ